ncbi:MAG: DegT/DnrJ/EryC1/StrS family aminotransferase [Acidobacteria bacterium]|nr:DegT/DnrJ/EryC1/StrS family aminotransferase [Acidobacteriota bacterium]
MISFYATDIGPEVRKRVSQILRSGWLSEGRVAREFESALASNLGLARPVSVNSGTSALHLALAVLGVGPGDEVILPAQTFVATGLSILMQRATPVFADINPATGNADPDSIRARLSDRTRAIMVVHWAGYPCDMEEISAVANERGIPVIEDAAHALGASYHDRPIGTWSRFTAFSFQAIKQLTTGDGGVLCCPNPEDEREARALRWFGIDRERDLPSHLGERAYRLEKLGFKYHMNDLAAAVGLGNLARFSETLERRKDITARYRKELAGIPGLTLLEEKQDRKSANWLFTIRVEKRDAFIDAMASRKVPTSVVHQRIDRNPIFGGPFAELAGQSEFDQTQISIPLHAQLSERQVSTVIRSIRAGW